MAESNSENSPYYSDDVTTFGERLAAARQVQKLEQHELAQRLGVRSKTIDNWENDRSEPSANRLQILAGLLSVSVAWLLTGVGVGLSGPSDTKEGTGNVEQILVEMQMISKGLAAATRRLTHIEKQVRNLL
jgi:transcriptional regulator with XRE-family HTH domain